MFFSKQQGKPQDQNTYGRVYVLKITLKDGTILHKVGMCRSSRSVDRMMEILGSFFKVYRYVPQCELRRDRKTTVPLLLEQHLHKLLEDYSYTFDKKFSGYKEFFFDLDEDVLLDYLDTFKYSELLEGKVEMKLDDYTAVKEEIKLQDKTTTKLLTIDEDKIPF